MNEQSRELHQKEYERNKRHGFHGEVRPPRPADTSKYNYNVPAGTDPIKKYHSEGTVAPAANMARRGVNKLNNTTKANAEAKIMSEQERRMAMYSRALGVMGAQYGGPGFGVSAYQLDEKESTAERKSAADRADEEKRQKKEGRYGEAHETKEIEKMQDKKLKNEDVEITKEMVLEYMISEGFATNEVSAEILHTHISDEFLAEIEEAMIAEMGPAYPSETKAQAKAQSDHRQGKSSAGEKTGKNPGLKASHTSGANRQD